MVIAVDDRGDVWNWSPNLLKVRPCNLKFYIDSFFVGTGDINEPGKVSTEADQGLKAFKPAFKDDDKYLEHTIRALKNVHQQFFIQKTETETPSVCQILPSIKSKVLSNVNICFSGVICTNTHPEHHEFWILATQFGATCQTSVTLDTTHLIAARVIISVKCSWEPIK